MDHLKRRLIFQRNPFSGAKMLVSGRGIWLVKCDDWKVEVGFSKNAWVMFNVWNLEGSCQWPHMFQTPWNIRKTNWRKSWDFWGVQDGKLAQAKYQEGGHYHVYKYLGEDMLGYVTTYCSSQKGIQAIWKSIFDTYIWAICLPLWLIIVYNRARYHALPDQTTLRVFFDFGPWMNRILKEKNKVFPLSQVAKKSPPLFQKPGAFIHATEDVLLLDLQGVEEVEVGQLPRGR